jgi:uncharacterized membrane protein YbhN (UPF0104 family)
MKRIYQSLGFSLAIVIFCAVAFTVFKDADPVSLLEGIGLQGILLNLLIGTVYFFSFGILMKVVYSHHYKMDLSWADSFSLPFSMHLWTYILPMKGGLIYQTFFVKAKYKLDMSKGFSVGVLVFAASLLITCFVGGALSFLVPNALPLQLMLLAMFGCLLFFLFAGRFVKKPSEPKQGLINRLIQFVQQVLYQFNEQTKDKTLLFKLILVTIASTLLHALWFFHCAYVLGYEPDAIGILLATLVIRIVMLFRVLPGNLGLQEVMIGSVFLAAGLGLQEGLTTGILMRLSSVILAMLFGATGLYFNFRYFETDSISDLISKLKATNN